MQRTYLVIFNDFDGTELHTAYTLEINNDLMSNNKLKLYRDIECTIEIEYDKIIEYFQYSDTDEEQIEVVDWWKESWFNFMLRKYFGRNYIPVRF